MANKINENENVFIDVDEIDEIDVSEVKEFKNFIEDSLMFFPKQTVDVFLKQKNSSELIALYVFYYHTAKWQKTNQPKCTTDYVANALHWNIGKVRKAKKQLIELGLIEDVRKIDPETKKVLGYYIKINYIFNEETVEEEKIYG